MTCAMHQAKEADNIEWLKATSICRDTYLRDSALGASIPCREKQLRKADSRNERQVLSQDWHAWSLCHRVGEWQASSITSRPRAPKPCQQMLKDRSGCCQAIFSEWSPSAADILVEVMAKIGPENQIEQGTKTAAQGSTAFTQQ